MNAHLVCRSTCLFLLSAILITGCKLHKEIPKCEHPTTPEYLAKELKIREIKHCTDQYGNPIEEDNLIIHFPASMPQAQIDAIRNTYHPDVVDSCLCDPRLQNWRWNDPALINIEETVSELTKDSKREGSGWGASLNYLVTAFDPTPIRQLSDTSKAGYSTEPLPPGKLIAILDTGLDTTYATMGALNLYQEGANGCAPEGSKGWNFVEDNNNIVDHNGHGTAVTSVVVQALGQASRAGQFGCGATFLILKVLDNRGAGNIFDGMCAIQYAVNAGAEVINMSWGYYNADDEYFRDSILSMTSAAEPRFVMSLGNAATDVTNMPLHYPSEYASIYNNIFPVAGDNRSEIYGSAAAGAGFTLASFSNYETDRLLITGPSVDIPVWGIEPAPQFRLASGTSYAAAMITAALAIGRCCDRTVPTLGDGKNLPGVKSSSTLSGGGTTDVKSVVLDLANLCDPIW